MTLQQLKYAVTIADCRSMNKAARELFITQPSLSSTIKDLEEELGITIFNRSNRGVVITPDGEEFLSYARQMVSQYQMIEDRYINDSNVKKIFSVSMQHYTFAVEAFMKVAEEFGMDDYEFTVHETRTYDVLENVQYGRSEVGVVYTDDFNEKALDKLFREKRLSFHELFTCHVYAYMAESNPLAGRKKVSREDLMEYPCLSFDQGDNNAFYLTEEPFSSYDYNRMVKVDDRATILNFMVGMNGYTLCSGIICKELNGRGYTAVPLDSDRTMRIGYVKRKGMPLSKLGESYIDVLSTYRNQVLA